MYTPPFLPSQLYTFGFFQVLKQVMQIKEFSRNYHSSHGPSCHSDPLWQEGTSKIAKVAEPDVVLVCTWEFDFLLSLFFITTLFKKGKKWVPLEYF